MRSRKKYFNLSSEIDQEKEKSIIITLDINKKIINIHGVPSKGNFFSCT